MPRAKSKLMTLWSKIFSGKGGSLPDRQAGASGEKKERKEERRAEKEELIKKETVGAGVIKEGRIIPGIIRSPRITEKTSGSAKENKYVFEVSARANKVDVKGALEARYGVNIEAVNIVNAPGKERRRGRQIGWKPGFKKAMVKVRQGQTIEIQ